MNPGGNDIDSLKFSIVLDSDKFEKEMKRVEGLAEKFEKSVREALTISNLLEKTQSKGAKDAEKKAKAQKDIVLLTRQELEAKKAAGTITESELKQLKSIVSLEKSILDEENKQLAAQKKKLDIESKSLTLQNRKNAAAASETATIEINTQKLLMQSSVLKGLGSYITQYASIFGAATVVRNLVRITGEFEAQHTALRAILQDTAAADNIFNQLQVLAVKSPFTFQNLTSYAKQLTAFSVPVNEVYETTKKLADVSAGLGVDMGRIILAYGQVRSAEFLRGQEVRQFTEAGIPILKELADQFKEIEGHAISVGEVFNRISARQVPFAMVEEAFNRMTSAGGKFYQMQEVLAETVKGKVSNLQDAWEIMLSRIGDEHSGTIKGIITWITNLLSSYEKWIGLLGGVVRYIGIYSALMLTYNSILKVSNGLAAIRNGLEVIRNKQLTLSKVLLSTEITLETTSNAKKKEEIALLATLNVARKAALGALSAIAAILWTVIQRQIQHREEMNKTTDTMNAAVAKLNASMVEFNIGANRVEEAFKKMKEAEGDAKDETKEFHRSVDELKKQFPKFIDDNIKLAGTIDDLGKYWARAREEMNQYYADEARESVHNDLRQNRDESINTLSKQFTKSVKSWFPGKDKDTLGKNYATMAWRYVIGDISRDEVMSIVSAMNAAYQSWSGTGLDYSNKILDDFDKFVERYKEIVGRYEEALSDADDAFASHSLTTKRATYNDYIFRSYNRAGFGNWSLDNGQNYAPYESFSEEQRRAIFDWWAQNNDIAVGAEESVDAWAERMREKLSSGAVSDKIKGVIRDAFEQFQIPENPGALSGWQLDLQTNVFDRFGEIIASALEQEENGPEDIGKFIAEHKNFGDKFKAKATDALEDYIDARVKDFNDVAKHLKQYPEKYANFNDAGFTEDWLLALLMRSISAEFYGAGNEDFSGTTKDAREKAKKKKQEEEEAKRKRKEWVRNKISDLKQDFQDLKELKTHYDKLKEFRLSDEQIDLYLREFYGRGIPVGGFQSAFEDIATRLEAHGDNNTARDVRNYVAGRSITSIENELEAQKRAAEDAEKALNKYLDALEKWEEKNEGELQGVGSEFNISKAIKNYRKSLKNADNTFYENAKLLESGTTDKNERLAGYGKLDEEWAKQRINALATLRSSIVGYADDIFNEQMKGYDLTNWNDKTLAQIREIKDAVANITIPDEIKKLLEKYPDILAELEKKIEEQKENVTEKTVKPEEGKKWVSYLQKTSSYLSKAASSMRELAEASGDVRLKNLSEITEGLSKTLDAAAAGYQMTNSWVGAVVGGILSISEQILSAISKAKAEALALQNAVYEAMSALDREKFTNALTVKNIFGENSIQEVQKALEQIDKLGDKFESLSSARSRWYSYFYNEVLNQEGFSERFAEWRKSFEEGGVEGTMFFTDNKWRKGAESLKQIAERLNLDLYDIYGNLNPELLRKIQELYGSLNKGATEWLTNAIAYSEEYREAMDKIKSTIESVIGSIASDAADRIVDGWIEAGNAALEYADILDSVARAYAKLLVQDVIMKSVFDDKREKELIDAFGDGSNTTRFMQLIAEDMEKIDALAPVISDILSTFEPYFVRDESEDSDSSLGQGIKGITEETASLLASYLNAIRADVSYGRIQWERIAVAVENQAGQYVTLNDYMAQVAANTFNNAQNTQRILSELQSVIGSEGSSGAIVRVQMS